MAAQTGSSDISQGWQAIPSATSMSTWPGCEASLGKLVNACDYSFADLYRAACATTSMPADESEVRRADLYFFVLSNPNRTRRARR